MTGPTAPGMESFDRLIPAFMHKWHIPGGSVAVVKDGRLVLMRGYGWADVEAHEPVRPQSLFRIASISKPLTAVAILKLVEAHRLELDDKVCSVLGQFPEGPHADERWRKITLRQLLHHTGGWDREQSFDPMFRPYKAAEAVGARPPASSATIVRYMLREPLDFEPGQRYAYSNFGYCLLGRVIEAKTKRSYEVAVRELVLQPCGIQRMRIGRTQLAGRAAGEVRYYHQPATELAKSVFPKVKEPVPWPYGGFYLEAMDSHGAWIASAVDLMRFVSAAEGGASRHCSIAGSGRRC